MDRIFVRLGKEYLTDQYWMATMFVYLLNDISNNSTNLIFL